MKDLLTLWGQQIAILIGIVVIALPTALFFGLIVYLLLKLTQ